MRDNWLTTIMAQKKKTRRTQKQRTEEARADIIRAAFTCFARFGYQGTSLQKIALQAGCSKELPRYHFGSKSKLVDYLLSSTVRDWTRIFDAPSQKHLSADAAFRNIYRAFGRMFSHDPELIHGQLTLIMAASDPSNVSLQNQVLQFEQALREAIKVTINKSLPEGHACTEEEIDALAVFVFCAPRGIAHQWLMGDQDIDMGKSFEYLADIVSLKLKSVTRTTNKIKQS